MKVNILKILAILFALMYLAVIVLFVGEISSVRHFTIAEINKDVFWYSVCAIILLPVLVVSNVWKENKKESSGSVVHKICECVVMFFVLLCSAVSYEVFSIAGGIYSYTTDLNNYEKRDNVMQVRMQEKVCLFPETIPQEAIETKYTYSYSQTLDDEICMTLSYRYEDESIFKDEIKRIEDNYIIVSKEEKDGLIQYYTERTHRVVYVTFDTKNKSVSYVYRENYEM